MEKKQREEIIKKSVSLVWIGKKRTFMTFNSLSFQLGM